MSFCEQDFLKYWTGYEVKVGVGNETLPFEEYFTAQIVKEVQASIEKGIWQGDTASEDANINKFDGLIKILNAADGVVKPTIASGTLDAIKSGIWQSLKRFLTKLQSLLVLIHSVHLCKNW